MPTIVLNAFDNTAYAQYLISFHLARPFVHPPVSPYASLAINAMTIKCPNELRQPLTLDSTRLTSSQLGLPRRASSARGAHLEMWPTSLTAMFMLINYAHITYVYHVWFILPPWSWMKICTWAWQCMKLCRWVASSQFSVLVWSLALCVCLQDVKVPKGISEGKALLWNFFRLPLEQTLTFF